MTKIEYDNFPKFLVSFGTILVALPFLTIHFFLQENTALLVKQEDIDKLTITAQQALKNKQEISFLVTNNFLLLAIGCIVIGFILLFLGCKKWHIMQKKLDDKQDIELEAAKKQLQKMTPEEEENKVSREIIKQEHLQIKKEINNKDDTYLTVNELRAKQEDLRKENQIIFNQISKRYIEAEKNVIDIIRTEFQGTHETQGNIKIGKTEFDAISISKASDDDYIFEIKYLFSTNSWNMASWEEISYKLHQQVDLYMEATQRKASPVLFLVTPDDQVVSLKKIASQRLTDKNINVRVLSETDVGIRA